MTKLFSSLEIDIHGMKISDIYIYHISNSPMLSYEYIYLSTHSKNTRNCVSLWETNVLYIHYQK